jgi:sterol 3beta-glucosyltransferase
MKIGIITQGSNGDAEIFVSLALELVKRNHCVELFIITLNNRDYSFLNKVDGLTVYQKIIYSEFKKNQEDLEFWKDSRGTIFAKIHIMIRDDLAKYSYKFVQESDVVIGSHYIFELASIAEKFNVPFVSVNCHLELIRTNLEAPFTLSHIKNKSISELWDIRESHYNIPMKRTINRFRKRNGLDSIKNVLQEVVRSPFLNLIPYSSHLYRAQSDWDETYKLCGYWKTSNNYNDWKSPKVLSDFLCYDEKPVLITVGSMVEHEVNIKSFHDLLLKAAHNVNRKVIILSNWEKECEISGSICRLSGFVSYPELFSKCSVIVHHGGIGTLHHVTEAGCPSVVITYGHDQPFNAKVLFDAGLSIGSISKNDLNADRLSELINLTLQNKKVTQKAKDTGLLIKKEKGVQNAVQYIESKMKQNIQKKNAKIVI